MYMNEKDEEQWFALEALYSQSGYNPLPAIKRDEEAANNAENATGSAA